MRRGSGDPTPGRGLEILSAEEGERRGIGHRAEGECGQEWDPGGYGLAGGELRDDADPDRWKLLVAARRSPVGYAGGPFSIEGMGGEEAARLDEFVRLTGFDPEEDLERVYVALTSTSDAAVPAFVAYGDFDQARLDAYIQERAPADAALERTTIGGLPVFLGLDDQGRRFGVALVNDDMVMAGEESVLRAMIDRLGQTGGGLASDAALMSLVERAAYPDGAWFAARGLDAFGMHDDGSRSDFAHAGSQMREGILSFDFRADGVAMQAVGFPKSGTRTDDLADLLRGGVAAMRTQSAEEPDVVRALDDVEVRSAGDAVTVEAFVPRPLFERMTHHD